MVEATLSKLSSLDLQVASIQPVHVILFHFIPSEAAPDIDAS